MSEKQPLSPEIKIKIAENETEFAAVFEIRRRVFVEEQGFALVDEYDGEDERSIHIMALAGKKPVGAARLIPTQGVATVGRVAVLPEWREQALGRKIMAFCEMEAQKRGFFKIRLHSQIQVRKFYEKLAYIPEGDVYDECGWPHITMTKQLGTCKNQVTHAPPSR